MNKPPRQILADNLAAIIKHANHNVTSWSRVKNIDKKRVQRAISGRHSTTLDVIAEIAVAARLQPWQLLCPSFDPANPPVVSMTQAEREFYRRVREDFKKLPPVNGDI